MRVWVTIRNTPQKSGIGLNVLYILTAPSEMNPPKGGTERSMYYTAKKEVILMLYRHILCTPEQLSITLRYQVPTIYGIVVELRKKGLLQSIQLSFLSRNRVAYALTAYGARAAAILAKEEEIYRPKAWEEAPVQLEHYFGTNAFFISLIRQSLPLPHEGLVEWLSTRESAERYAHFKESGKKTLPLRPDGMGTYTIQNQGRIVFHLEYDTGSENLWRIQDKLWNYGRILPDIWNEVESIHLLIVTKVENRPKQIIQLWEALREGPLAGVKLPQVWSISEREWKQKGASESEWLGAKGKRARFKEMQVLPCLNAELPYLGKQQRDRPPSIPKKKR
jgi:hypothetical protein